MKQKILNNPVISFFTHLRISQWAANHPVLSRFCNYEVISYIICGVLTTVVDYVTYFVGKGLGMSTAAATTLAWVLAVIFAFFVNKIFVFFSEDWSRKGLTKEFLPFLSCRILTYFLNLAFMVITVDVLHLSEVLMKILSNIIVLIVNYIGSKLLVFRK